MEPSGEPDPPVDALIASRSPLPPLGERRRLRQAHALTLDEVAAALDVRRATIGGWESGKAEPIPPQREAYARLLALLAQLAQLAQLYPPSRPSAARGPRTGGVRRDGAAAREGDGHARSGLRVRGRRLGALSEACCRTVPSGLAPS